MRRQDRQVTDFREILKIVDRCEVCRLAMVVNGAPYVIPMNFGWAEEDGALVLYLHSAVEGTKIDALAADERVCFEMDTDGRVVEDEIPCRNGYLYASVIGTGQAEFLSTPQEKTKGLNCIMRHLTGKEYEYHERALPFVAVFRVRAKTLTCKRREQ